jgi:nitrilase
LLFPESFIPCYPRGLSFYAVIGKRTDRSREIWLDYWQNAIEVQSKDLDKIKKAIKNAELMVALGVTEKEINGGSLHCSLLYFDCLGNLIGKHRKLKPTGLERLIWGEGDGTTLTTFESEFGKIGGLICWENYMPLARMSMYQKVLIYIWRRLQMPD